MTNILVTTRSRISFLPARPSHGTTTCNGSLAWKGIGISAGNEKQSGGWKHLLTGPSCGKGRRHTVSRSGISIVEKRCNRLVARFRQDAHNYLTHVPALPDIASWYALMQHFGAPTPLLDWTESPYVAGYFALEEKASFRRKRERESYSAVWAIEAAWVEAKEKELFKSEVLDSNGLLGHKGPIVVRINPSMSNPRLFAQQGICLCKLFDEASFGQLLMTMMMHEELTTRPSSGDSKLVEACASSS